MLLDKYKRIIAIFVFAFVTMSVFAADTSALVKKQLTAAEDAMDEGDIETAYKKVNGALQMMNDAEPSVKSAVVSEAKLVYQQKLEGILETLDGVAFSEVKVMLERYPDVKNTKIEKLLAKIEEKQKIETENQRKAELAASEAAAQKRHNEEQQSMKHSMKSSQQLEKAHEAMKIQCSQK